jgi:hypothetical protein
MFFRDPNIVFVRNSIFHVGLPTYTDLKYPSEIEYQTNRSIYRIGKSAYMTAVSYRVK